MHDHLSTFKPLNLKFVKRFSEDFIYQNQDLSNPLLQVLESNIGASGHSTKPLPACPRLKWAAPQPLNRTSPSNLYKSQKLLSLNVESPLLPVFYRQVGLNSYDYIQQLCIHPLNFLPYYKALRHSFSRCPRWNFRLRLRPLSLSHDLP